MPVHRGRVLTCHGTKYRSGGGRLVSPGGGMMPLFLPMKRNTLKYVMQKTKYTNMVCARAPNTPRMRPPPTELSVYANSSA